MTLLHVVLGAAAVLLNAGAAVIGLALREGGDRFWRLSTAGLAVLILQLASGFFLLTGTNEDLVLWHVLAPGAATGVVLLGRSRSDDEEVRPAAAAAALATVAAVYAFASGYAARG